MSAVIDEAVDDLTSVRAVLNYTRNTGIRPVNYVQGRERSDRIRFATD